MDTPTEVTVSMIVIAIYDFILKSYDFVFFSERMIRTHKSMSAIDKGRHSLGAPRRIGKCHILETTHKHNLSRYFFFAAT